MPKMFQTLVMLPDMSQTNRFAQLSFGASNIETLRAEHQLLKKTCAALLGVETDALTQDDVTALASRQLVPPA